MLRNYIVRRNQQTGNATIAQKADGEVTHVYALDVRGVIVWPDVNTTGYVAIYALLSTQTKTGKFKVKLIHEYESLNPSNLFKAIYTMEIYYTAHIFYADIRRKENQDFVQMFSDFKRFQRKMSANLMPAPFAKQYGAGFSVVQEYVKAQCVEMPKSSRVYKQLSEMEEPFEPEKSAIDEQFYAVKGLMFALGTIESGPWNYKPAKKEKTLLQSAMADFGAWS